MRLLMGVACALVAVGAGWAALLALGADWGALALAGGVVATGGVVGAVWLLGVPLVADVRHTVRDVDERDNYAYATQRLHRRQDRVQQQAAARLWAPARAQRITVNGVADPTVAALQAIRTAQQQQAAELADLRARFTHAPDAPPLVDRARVPAVWHQERVTERLPPQHTPYSSDMRMVVELACQARRVLSQEECRKRGLPKNRWSAATAALWTVGVLVKGDKPNDPYQLAPWVKTAAVVSLAFTGEE